MTTEQTSIDEIRAAARNLLETCDKREAIADGTVERIESDPIFKAAVDHLVAAIDEHGLYFSLPILQEVESEYRNQNPTTKIPVNAFGTLIGYCEYESDEEERPLCKSRRWKHAAAVVTLPPQLAKCIQEMPHRMAVRLRYHLDAKINGSGCETLLDDLIEVLTADKFEWPESLADFNSDQAIGPSNASQGTISDEEFLRTLEEMEDPSFCGPVGSDCVTEIGKSQIP